MTREQSLQISECQVINKKDEGPGSVNDSRMGTIHADIQCKTCGQTENGCPGHFGHIELPYPLFIPIFMSSAIHVLRCICHSCFKIRLDDSAIVSRMALKSFSGFEGVISGKPISEWHPLERYQWFKTLSKSMHGMKRCLHCKTECISWGYNKFTRRPKYKQEDLFFDLCANINYTETFGDGWFTLMMDKVDYDDLVKIGIARPDFHPRDFVTDIIPVLPIISRPPVEIDTKIYPDAITEQYHSIMKAIVDMRKSTKAKIEFENRFGSVHFLTTKINELKQKLIPTMSPDGEEIWDSDMQEITVRKNAEYTIKMLTGQLSQFKYIMDDINSKITEIRFRWGTLAINKKGECKYARGKKPIKSIKDRISGKHGQLRYNLMGKRTDYCARSVATGDPNLDLNEVGVPKSIASKLTIPVRVSDLNRDELEFLVNVRREAGYVSKNPDDRIFLSLWYQSNPLFVPGDKITRNGIETVLDIDTSKSWKYQKGDLIQTRRFDKQIVPSTIEKLRDIGIIPWIRLSSGTIVERFLRDGDYVLLNRYPSLHKMSMMGYRVKVMPIGDTLRINLSSTSPLNCDFDGDEINIWIIQSDESRTELQELCDVKHNIVSAQSNKPVIGLVQEELLGVCKMSLNTEDLDPDDFFDLAMAGNIDLDTLEKTQQRMEEYGPRLCDNPPSRWSTQTLLSCIFSPTFNYTKDDVIVKNGLLLAGTLNKGIVGKAKQSLIHILWKTAGHDAAMNLIHQYSRMGIQYLMQIGFSVGIGDCIASDRYMVDSAVSRAIIRAEQVSEDEQQVNAALNAVRNISKSHCEAAFSKDNPFLQMIHAGSKGDYFNIFGISGALGQQNVEGARIALEFKGRSLPHFPPNDTRPAARGFVSSSYIQGLTPTEMYFHAMSGREGLTDTAIKTAKSGYGQRRMIKFMEDIDVAYDGTVRDKAHNIIQFKYGEDGFAGEELIHVKGAPLFIDIFKTVDELNCVEEYETDKLKLT